MRILWVSALFILCSVVLRAQPGHAFPKFNNTPLEEVLLYLEANFDLSFSYRDRNINEEFINIDSHTSSVQDYLEMLFEQTQLDYEFIDQRHLILTKKEAIPRPEGWLCGYVRDEDSGKLLPYANILLKREQKGVNTNPAGRFEVVSTMPRDTLLISYIGYHPLEIVLMDQKNGTQECLDFQLRPKLTEIETVVVTVYLMDGILQDGKGQKILIKPDKLSVFPGAVEPDIMTSLQMLPGIFSADETVSGVNIRGGTPDQNLVLYDGIPVYHTGHFFGMISAFNPYIVDNVKVYRSGMGSEYGGRVSGVIDIQSSKEAPEEFELGLGLNLTHGHINSNIPLWKKSGLTISMRRSFTDFLPSPTFLSYAEKVFQGTKLEEEQIPGSNFQPNDKFYFSDFNFKWIWQPGKSKFGIDLFSGFNSLDYTSEVPEFQAFSKDVVELENIGFRVYWERQWNERFSSMINLTSSTFSYNYNLSFSPLNFPNLVLLNYNTVNDVEDGGFNWINTWKIKKGHQFKFGYQFTNNDIGLALTKDEFTIVEEETQNFKHQLHTLFGEYHLSLADILDVDLGVRYQRQPLIENDYFEPRVALTARVNTAFKLKISSSKQFQFVSQLVFLDLDEVLFGNKIWIASNNTVIPVIESNQWTGGILFSKNDWQIDLEGYVKELAGLTSFSSSFGEIPDQPYSRGNSRIRGIDVLVKRKFNPRYRSWLSYTLSNAVYEFPELSESVFPASHDQRHTIQWVHLYTPRPWEFAVGWQLGSGLPFTNAIDTDIRINPNGSTTPFIIYDQQNASRLEPYHRLDASVMYHFKKQDKFTGFFGLSLINVYNQKNILGKQFLLEEIDPQNNEYEFLKIDRLGLRFTPNLVARIQW